MAREMPLLSANNNPAQTRRRAHIPANVCVCLQIEKRISIAEIIGAKVARRFRSLAEAQAEEVAKVAATTIVGVSEEAPMENSIFRWCELGASMGWILCDV